MDIKHIIADDAAGLVGAGASALSEGGIQIISELPDQSAMDKEIDAAWEEKELADAEKAYYREQRISDEIQRSWIEKEMLDDGYSIEEVNNAMSDDILNEDNGEENAPNNDAGGHDYGGDGTEPRIDNTDLSYERKYICIRLNNNPDEFRNRLRKSEEKLRKKFPGIREMQAENKLRTILENEFRDGFPKNIYIRNLTFQKGERDVPILAIRPEIAPGDYLLELLPEGVTLMFRGHVYGREFIVDDVYDAADTERLDFEASASVIPLRNPIDMRLRNNFFYDVLDYAESLAKYTGERLDEWKEYLKWHKQICIRQVHGIKYYRFQYDAVKKQVVFWLVCKDESYFKELRRYLGRDIQVFDNSCSQNEWIFEFALKDDEKRRFSRSIELGRFRGVRENYYLEYTDHYNMNVPEERQFDYTDYDEDSAEPIETQSSPKNLTEDDVHKAFERPYIVKAAYDLPRDIKDRLQDTEFLSEEDEQLFIEENYLADFSPDGFLALSAVGDLALIRRFERAIQSLERDECYSPNLAAWLFNAAQARLPDDREKIEIERWLNPDIAENENQREAVRKMLAAPDICLIQGPPGTGKTTVIAEAIYQLAMQGNRVLVASQSNDAVDNALERLADTPEIRAIRLGQKSRKKKNVDLNKRKFSEDEALKYYYHSLSLTITDKWLGQWERLENQRSECRKDAGDVQNYQLDIAEYQERLNRIITDIQELKRDDASLREQIQQINQQNAYILDAKQKAHSYENIIKGISDSGLFLTEQQLRIVERFLNPVVEDAREYGIRLSLKELHFEEQGAENESEFLRIIIARLPVLKNICRKLAECGQRSVQNESSIALLNNRRDEIRSQIADAAEADDMDAVAALRKQLNAVKEKIEAANGPVVSLGAEEKSVLSEALFARITSGNADEVRENIENIIVKTEEALLMSLSEVMAYSDGLQPADISGPEERRKAVDSQLAQKQQQWRETNSALQQKQGILLTLSRKYKTSSSDAAAVRAAIEQALRDTEKELSESEAVRRQWEDVMSQFNRRLNDERAFACDQQYYQPIYVNSCNVVGISCTDNMRALTDNGYDDFDVVIIDEVSKATPPELLIPLMKARKAILVGDHRQLPPMFKEHEQSYNDLISDQESIPEELRDLMTAGNFRRFRNMVTSSLFKEYFERADDSIRHPLLVQYRMHSDIMRVINRFYENRLINGLTPEQETERKAHGLTIRGADCSEFIVPAKHAYWLDSSALPSGKPIFDSKSNPATKNEGGTSVYNTLEQYMIIELLKKMADSWRESYQKEKIKKTVGVISFYQAQVNRIREMFRDAKRGGFDFSPLDVDINTVDRFQGKEKNIVIASLVTNSPKGWASKHVIAFERINVAFSRAQQLLVIVGAKHTYEKQEVVLPNMDNAGTSTVSVYQNIMEEMHRNGCFKGSEKLITPDIEAQILKEYQGGEDE